VGFLSVTASESQKYRKRFKIPQNHKTKKIAQTKKYTSKSEEFIPGRTENLHDYLIPTTGDMPRITSILLEVADPEGPMGAKGLGEHVLIPTAPAILSAIRHASGARITHLPALPHRVLAAIREARK